MHVLPDGPSRTKIEYKPDQPQDVCVQIRGTEFRGDIHIGESEKRWMSQVQELTGEDTPFWIVVAGGKWDYTLKWWDPRRYQRVVDHFRGSIQFVQVGERGHWHPRLDGTEEERVVENREG